MILAVQHVIQRTKCKVIEYIHAFYSSKYCYSMVLASPGEPNSQQPGKRQIVKIIKCPVKRSRSLLEIRGIVQEIISCFLAFSKGRFDLAPTE